MIHAQAALKKSCKICQWSYKEANLLEEGIREEGANSEITSNILLQTVRKNIKFYKKKTKYTTSYY